ncbi:MAG: ketoacyl-ACP synthase III [Acidimicrobiales bacterium]|jgi:3-oxoacyl-[acyl-carrier-protein] synthase-3|nr:ketoacyl-ACP synthase III [Acidimicrobiales bacterium]
MTRRTRIAGIGSFVPDRIVTNDDMTQWMDTSDEWIQTRSGIEQRHWVEPDNTTTSDLGLEAANKAMAAAGVTPADLDMILFATLSPDHEFPGTACFLQAKLGCPEIPAIDVRQQCSGFVYGMAQADMFIRGGMADTILLVGAEIHSKGLDVSTEGRDITVLFGDGAGAAILQATDVDEPASQPHIYSSHLHADGTHAKELWTEGPSMTYAPNRWDNDWLERKAQYPYMNGKKVFKHAVTRMPEVATEALDANGYTVEDVDLWIFHQANMRINYFAAKTLGIEDEDKVFNTIQRFGNTTAATIPIGLDEALKAGKLEPGMLVCIAAFGAGFTWASSLVRWG